MKERQPKVVIGIVEKEGKVLMVRRAIKEDDLLWSFPGGKMDPEDNSEQNAVVREVREETNVECLPVSNLGSRVHPNTEREISYWRCKYLSGEPEVQNSEEITETLWVSSSKVFELVTTDIFSPIRSMLEELSPQ